MEKESRKIFPFLIALVVLVAVVAPYVYAAISAGEEHYFGGFLLNPTDGYSYLAKMYQGWEGNWHYQMAFSAQPGEGAYINLLYLFLGHVARITNLPMLIVFHTARILGAMVLLWTIWHFFGVVLPNARTHRLAFALAALGSGMGWLAIPSGTLTADMWVAETFPFLSAYSNPHFTLSLALVLWLILPSKHRPSPVKAIAVLLASFFLSVISPFGVILVLIIQGGVLLFQFTLDDMRARFTLKRDEILLVGLTLIGGSPLLVYDYWIAQTDPVIADWNAQNLTPSPALWDLIISLSPAFILAVIGGWLLIKKQSMGKVSQPLFVFLVWTIMGLGLVYFPFDLQRRFMMGLYIPFAALAAKTLDYIFTTAKAYKFGVTLLFVLAVPTNLVVLMASIYGINNRLPEIFLTQNEREAINWIVANSDDDALILSSPEMGAYIPAFTGRRVIYGHPFETINADEEGAAVLRFFRADFQPDQVSAFLRDRQINFIFYGPREQGLGESPLVLDFATVFSSGNVIIYQVEE